MPKVSVLTKSKTFGKQYSIIDLSKCDMLGMLDAEGTEDKINKALNQGKDVFQLNMENDTKIVYASQETDGLCRDLDAYFELYGFDTNVRINNKQQDQGIWATDVEIWFDWAMQSALFKENLNVRCERAIATPPGLNYKTKLPNEPFDMMKEIETCKLWLKEQRVSKAGATGRRPELVNKYILNWFDKAVDNYLFSNSAEYRKEKLSKKRK